MEVGQAPYLFFYLAKELGRNDLKLFEGIVIPKQKWEYRNFIFEHRKSLSVQGRSKQGHKAGQVQAEDIKESDTQRDGMHIAIDA